MPHLSSNGTSNSTVFKLEKLKRMTRKKQATKKTEKKGEKKTEKKTDKKSEKKSDDKKEIKSSDKTSEKKSEKKSEKDKKPAEKSDKEKKPDAKKADKVTEEAKKADAKKKAVRERRTRRYKAENLKRDLDSGVRKPSHHLKRKLAARNKLRVLESGLKDQFNTGRILARISSRPGQSGRADGYILEGEELAFYQRKIEKKRKE